MTDNPYRDVMPTVELIGPGNTVLATDTSFTVTHTLDPVMTSHAGQYTCRASVVVASVRVHVGDHSSSNLTVQSKLESRMSLNACIQWYVYKTTESEKVSAKPQQASFAIFLHSYITCTCDDHV